MPGHVITLDIQAPAPVTISVAAFAAGVSPDCMRGWLKRDALHLLVPRRTAGAWLRVAPVDIVRMAVLGHLVRFGLTVAEGAAIVRDRVDRQIEGVVMVAGDAPWSILVGQFRGRTLTVARDRFGSPAVAPNRFSHHSLAALHINLGAIAFDACRRVRAHSTPSTTRPAPMAKPELTP